MKQRGVGTGWEFLVLLEFLWSRMCEEEFLFVSFSFWSKQVLKRSCSGIILALFQDGTKRVRIQERREGGKASNKRRMWSWKTEGITYIRAVEKCLR